MQVLQLQLPIQLRIALLPVKLHTFNGTTSIIEIPNGDQLMNPDFTLSFWVKAVTQDKGHFVIGLGAFYGFQFEIAGDFTNCKLAAAYSYQGGGDTAIFTDNWWNGDGKNKDNGGWQGWTLNKDMTGSGGIPSLLKDTWAHVVCTYNSATRVGNHVYERRSCKSSGFQSLACYRQMGKSYRHDVWWKNTGRC